VYIAGDYVARKLTSNFMLVENAVVFLSVSRVEGKGEAKHQGKHEERHGAQFGAKFGAKGSRSEAKHQGIGGMRREVTTTIIVSKSAVSIHSSASSQHFLSLTPAIRS
jgi:hypothetical protein